jgi:uncharacterized protein
MTRSQPRVVYDAAIYLQSLISTNGTSARCMDLFSTDVVTLLVSRPILLEVGDVLSRPSLRVRFPRVTDDRAYRLLLQVRSNAEVLEYPPHAMHLPRDPDDEPYLDLAVAAQAGYLVTWNQRHLTYLMRGNTPEGKEFCSRFPHLQIVDPVTFLRAVEAAQAPPAE